MISAFRQTVLMLSFLLVAPAAIALAQEAARVPVPDIPEAAAGTRCVADPAFMRRNHMSMLKHDRDLTVHDGNRAPQASLKECISCHAVKGDEGKPVTAADPRHFCRACHDYAAVKIDCFECHASRSGDDEKAARLSDPGANDVAALSDYLKGVEQ